MGKNCMLWKGHGVKKSALDQANKLKPVKTFLKRFYKTGCY